MYVHWSACYVSLNHGLGFGQICYCGVNTDILSECNFRFSWLSVNLISYESVVAEDT